MAEKFNPFNFSAADSKKSLLDNYSDRRKNSLRRASVTITALLRGDMKRAGDKLLKARDGAELELAPADIDEMIIQLMQARRDLCDVNKCEAVIQALNQIEV